MDLVDSCNNMIKKWSSNAHCCESLGFTPLSILEHSLLVLCCSGALLRGICLTFSSIVCRDINCANALVDSDGELKLADYGLVKQVQVPKLHA